MTRLRLRLLLTASVITAAVIMQTPAMFAVKGTSSHAHVDHEIAQLQADGTAVTVHVIVVAESRSAWASIVAALNGQGFKVGRPTPLSNTLAVTIPSSALGWLEGVPGVASISIDAPVSPSPVSAEAVLTTNSAKLLVKASELRAQLGLTDSDPTGNGIGVAIVDSGIAPVTDFAGRISAFYDFTGGKGAVATLPVDGYGHGTHV